MTNQNAGIYIIKNKVNGKCYIGKSLDIDRRKYNHFLQLEKGIHPNKKLQQDFLKYGKNNFDFIIKERNANNMKLLKLEKRYAMELEDENLYNERLTTTPKKGLSTFVEKKIHEIVLKNIKERKITIADWVREAVIEKIERDDLLEND